MKINWKLRVQSYPFWVAVFGLIGLIVTHYLGFDAGEYQLLIDAILGVMIAGGLVADPTTKGMSDSKQAMGYDKPRGDK
ncbi:phage holin [Bacillus benzoevorans]|uniref:Phi LC3 family holin n=1 Tax=Bacillus benzoevorans TaxID=1456 RepID=A0A7X0HT92_9BACI|nr:phage holin [Bacillus benzoevorans]MBB6446439.1 phi LC3 family holin [Bacillus benzoevorans]